MYFITPPRLLKWITPGVIWSIPVEKDEKILYFTFDDGPHPVATPFVLEQLRNYDAKATFFCIGRNVTDHIEIYKQVIDEGHSVGNHTYDHLNGWKTKDKAYIDNIRKAATVIDSTLFRPPYGRITKFQASVLNGRSKHFDDSAPGDPDATFKIIMWSVLAGDWDQTSNGKKCYENVILNAKSGSIVVFHDSAKALERLEYALPKLLEHYSKEGFVFRSLQNVSAT